MFPPRSCIKRETENGSRPGRGKRRKGAASCPLPPISVKHARRKLRAGAHKTVWFAAIRLETAAFAKSHGKKEEQFCSAVRRV